MKTKEKIFWLSMIVLAIVLLTLHFRVPTKVPKLGITPGSSKSSVHKYMSKSYYSRIPIESDKAETYSSSFNMVIITYRNKLVSSIVIYPKCGSEEERDRCHDAYFQAMLSAYGSPYFNSYYIDSWSIPGLKRFATATLKRNPCCITIEYSDY